MVRWVAICVLFSQFIILLQQCASHGKDDYSWSRQSMVKQGYEVIIILKIVSIFIKIEFCLAKT